MKTQGKQTGSGNKTTTAPKQKTDNAAYQKAAGV